MEELQNLPGVLLGWYDENKRSLPWRETGDAYRIWLSEVMLQQTRVEAVKGYYERFLEALPDIASLAHCDDERLHKLWEGLGYYSRVRNLKKAAIAIMEHHGGLFPQRYEDILALPGIGEYTAGAIASIAFGQKTPAVDGNVLRVVARLTGDDTPIDMPAFKKAVRQALISVYPQRAGDFTQALMELGATVCGPNRLPECEQCPCKSFCRGFREGTAAALPVKQPKKAKREEKMTVFLLSCQGRFALQKRKNSGLLANLWQFPNVPGHLEEASALEAAETMGLRPRQILLRLERQHIFTHIRWDMRCYYLEVAEQAGDFAWLTAKEIEKEAALPTAFRQFWQEVDHV